MEPVWLTIARRYDGTKEIPGKENSPVIVGWLIRLKAWWRDDATPWCGVFVAECLSQAGLEVPKHWYRASAYLNWGVSMTAPRRGCVVVYERKGGGHVGFVVGIDEFGNIMTLGGNQRDSVCTLPFSAARVLGYRWPSNEAVSTDLPLLASDGQLSGAEA